MEINYNDLLSIQDILADVTVEMGDAEMRKLTPGYYRAQVKNAINELGFEAPFITNELDYPVPSDLIIEMPEGVYDLTAIQVFTGTPDDVGYVEKVYWKRDAVMRGYDKGYTANRHPYNYTDPFVTTAIWDNNKYFFNVHNGRIYLSDSCIGFDYVKLVFKGIPSKNLDTVGMIPPQVRDAVKFWTLSRCASAVKVKEPVYRQVQADAEAKLDEYGMNGAWHNAVMRIKSLDYKMLRDVIAYNIRLEKF